MKKLILIAFALSLVACNSDPQPGNGSGGPKDCVTKQPGFCVEGKDT